MRIAATLSALVIVGAVAYFLYWQPRLDPVMEAEGLELRPKPLALAPPVAVRPVDLGFAAFELPGSLSGELVEHGSSLFVSVRGRASDETLLTICPPMPDSDPEVQALLQDFADITGERPLSYWELRKRALLVQPFSVWSVLLRRQERVTADLTLLALKATLTKNVESLGIYEDERLGVTVTTRPDVVFFHVADKRAGIGQLFVATRGAVDARALISALAKSYRVTTNDFNDKHLATLLRQTGIARQMVASARSPSAAETADDEEARFSKVLEQIRALRSPREQRPKGDGGAAE